MDRIRLLALLRPWNILRILFASFAQSVFVVSVEQGHCDNDHHCIDFCQKASLHENKLCDLSCNGIYQRCECRVGALLVDSTCTEYIEDVPDLCAPAYEAVLNVAILSSPEFGVSDLYADHPPYAFVGMIRESVAQIISRSARNVGLGSVTSIPMLEKQPTNLSDRRGRLLHFDLNFTFCATGYTPSVTPSDFESGVNAELNRYAAFHLSSMRLTSFTQFVDGSRSVKPKPQQTGRNAHHSGCPGCDTSTDTYERVFVDRRSTNASYDWLLIGTLGALCVNTIVLLVCWISRKQRQKKRFHQQAVEYDNGTLAAPSVQDLGFNAPPTSASHNFEIAAVAIAVVVGSYSPDPGTMGAITLEEGDIVEVVAGSGGWLFGKILGVADCAGYFPEDCVKLLGMPASPGFVEESTSSVCADLSIGRNVLQRYAHEYPRERPVEDALGVNAPPRPIGTDDDRCDSSIEPREDAPLPSSCAFEEATTAEATQMPTVNTIEAQSVAQSHADQDFIAKAIASFHPSELANAEASNENAFVLEEGDIVQVLAGSEGWLYGAVVGVPGRVGYFPENRIIWLNQPHGNLCTPPCTDKLLEEVKRQLEHLR